MKKTVIALAIAAMAATSANAATVYEQDGTKVEVGGSLRVLLGKFGHNQRGDLKNDGSRLKVSASHKLSDDFKAFAAYESRFNEKQAKNNQKADTGFGNIGTKKLYLGLDFANVGAVSFGRQLTNADDVIGDS